MKICVLQADYSTSSVDYQNFDPARDLSPLLPDCVVDHVYLNKLTVYSQLKSLKKRQYDIFVNLCEGYLEWSVPSIEVIHYLELLNLPYTGPTAMLYDPSKELMKYVAFTEGINTPDYWIIESLNDLLAVDEQLVYPLFVKPLKAGDSLGIDQYSLVHNKKELILKVNAIIEEFDQILIERYIKGREFTVLIAADPQHNDCRTFQPIEYVFPEGPPFKTYALKTSELHPDANIAVTDSKLDFLLRESAKKIFRSFNGVGYARLDFRLNEDGILYFLEINFTCSVFYNNGMEGSADHILNYDKIGKAGFLQLIIAEGMQRHLLKQKIYSVKGNAIAGYGIYANRNIAKGEIIFYGEGKSQRLITKNFVSQNWTEQQIEVFKRYAYPVSKEIYLLWDENPAEWAPQNHSCNPNSAYKGLNVIAIQTIAEGEELTLDYSSFLDTSMQPFLCKCGSANCRGLITGKPNNSLTNRESDYKE